MEPLEISLSTFLKISVDKPRSKISTVSTFMAPGGYDFYKVAKKLERRLAKKEIVFSAAEQEIAIIKRAPERAHTLEVLQKFNSWLATNKQPWADPPKATYVSPSKVLRVRLNPELAFVNGAGGKTSLLLWNMSKPALIPSLAAEGIQCLVNEISLGLNDEIGILDVRKMQVLDKSLASAGAKARLAFDLNIVEEIWKALNNPAMEWEDAVKHITAIGGVPPAL